MTVRARPRAEGGFTLIEVLGAAVVMAIGLLALVNVMNFAYRMQTRALGNSVEWTVMQALMDVYLGMPFDCFDPTATPIEAGTNVSSCGGSSYTFPTVGDLLTQAYPDDDDAYSDWSYSIDVVRLTPEGQEGGDGRILRRLDVTLRKSSAGFEDRFTLVAVDSENLVP